MKTEYSIVWRLEEPKLPSRLVLVKLIGATTRGLLLSDRGRGLEVVSTYTSDLKLRRAKEVLERVAASDRPLACGLDRLFFSVLSVCIDGRAVDRAGIAAELERCRKRRADERGAGGRK